LLERIFELFNARNETVPNHAKSIQMCKPNTISMPANDHISIASEINLNPIANHQIIKNGFNALNVIPAINGPCFKFDRTSSFFPSAVLICIAANTKSVMAPKMEIIVLNSGNDSREKNSYS